MIEHTCLIFQIFKQKYQLASNLMAIGGQYQLAKSADSIVLRSMNDEYDFPFYEAIGRLVITAFYQYLQQNVHHWIFWSGCTHHYVPIFELDRRKIR